MKKTQLSRILARQELVLAVILTLYMVFAGIMNPTFFRLDNIFDIVRTSSGMMILSMGTLLVLISGGLDLSLTAIAIVSAYASIRLFVAFDISNLFLAFLLSGVIGLLMGAFNGFLIQYFKLQPMIVTLGTQNIYIGILSLTLGTKFIPSSKMPEAILNFGSKPILSIPVGNMTAKLSQFLIPVLIIIVLTWFILNHTILGRWVYALGGDPVSAQRAGVPVAKTRLFVYSYIGFLSGIMGIIYSAEVRSLNPISLVGTETIIIAAVVLGGARLTGGHGTVLGTVLGVLIITVLNTTLILIGLSASWNNFFVGFIIVASVSFTSFKVKQENRNRLTFY